MSLFAVFFVTVFGIWNVVRVVEHFRTEKIVDNVSMTKIVAAFLAWILLISVFTGGETVIFLALTISPSFFLHFLPSILRFYRVKSRKTDVLAAVRTMILKMKIGFSFGQALNFSVEATPARSRSYIQQIADLVLVDGSVGKRSFDPLTNLLCAVFSRCQRETHSAIAHLEGLRYALELEERFERKLETATRQAKAQAVVALVLFAGLLLWVEFQFGLRRYLVLTVISSIFTLAGFISVIRMGRKFQWKV